MSLWTKISASCLRINVRLKCHTFFIVPEVSSLCVFVISVWFCIRHSYVFISLGWDELWAGLPGGRRVPWWNAQWNRVPRGSAVSVWPPPGPLLLCDTRLLSLHAEHPRRFPQWLETRCSYYQLLHLGYFKVCKELNCLPSFNLIFTYQNPTCFLSIVEGSQSSCGHNHTFNLIKCDLGQTAHVSYHIKHYLLATC